MKKTIDDRDVENIQEKVRSMTLEQELAFWQQRAQELRKRQLAIQKKRNLTIPRIDKKLMEEIVRRIVETTHPEKIILFGSRARGHARSDSDLDILVIKESDEPRYQRSAPLYALLADLPVEIDILVYTPQEVWEWSAVAQAFITTAIREGQVLYERKN